MQKKSEMKVFEQPTAEMLFFKSDDVITTSGGLKVGTDNNEGNYAWGDLVNGNIYQP